ncbi:glucokinase [Luteimonas sp. MC1825]|uniref:glucokinase n=1 Tax=Luteimonas sp. MC1825 TaxID=2761107 RepID=UPI00160CF513|nr:glucokinase [Luteimonas sp. MC1825]MBB6600389.1 glucokinase [Luteimonas sp. MC1825]QOC88063.1 glucokinase [Luteimonas sp. MC1825]
MTNTLALIADIGGTNARFALCDPDEPVPRLLQSQSLRTAGFASLQHAAEHYLAGLGARPRRAAIALACPVDGDEIRLTNRAWSFNRHELRASLGLEELRLINDFGAVARAVPVLSPSGRVALYGQGHDIARGPVSVLGPGTGFGVGLLVGDATRGWHAVETEGGHVSFAPLGEEERALADWAVARHGRVSWERLLSGNGLAAIDAVLRQRDGEGTAGVTDLLATPDSPLRDPADIVAAALDGHDVASRRALARFCAILGSVAGDLALVHGARAVVIAGGIVPRFIPFLRASAFRERFLAKGRFAAYLEPVSIQVATHPNPGLLGAAMALREPVGDH